MKTSLLRFDPSFLSSPLPHFIPSPSSSKGTGRWGRHSVPGDGKQRCQCIPSCCVPWCTMSIALYFPAEMCFTGSWLLFFKLVSLKPSSYLICLSVFSPRLQLFQEWRVAFSSSISIFCSSDICCKLTLFLLNYLNLLVRIFTESKREGMQAQKKE